MDTGAWPDQGAASAVEDPSLGARPRSPLPLGPSRRTAPGEPRQQGRRGRFTQLVAADAPAAAPEAAPGRTVISAASAPRPAVPAEAASARDRRRVGWRHRHCAHRSKRLRIMGCQCDHQPDAGCRKQNRLPHGLSPLAFDCRPAGDKACSVRKGNRIARRRGRAFTVRSRPASGIASRKAPARRPRSRVSNFEQTGEAGAGNCRTDGRVAQSAERVREQHETVVRNHSPAAIPLASGRQRTQAHGRSGNEPTRPLPRLMECGGPCGPRGK